jgi:hypothetical protein
VIKLNDYFRGRNDKSLSQAVDCRHYIDCLKTWRLDATIKFERRSTDGVCSFANIAIVFLS